MPGSSLDVVIPPGGRDGQTLRLAGKGEPGAEGGEPGDALVEIAVRPHPFFKRDGYDINLDLPITLGEGGAGRPGDRPDANRFGRGDVPEGSNTGRVLRGQRQGRPATATGEATNISPCA